MFEVHVPTAGAEAMVTEPVGARCAGGHVIGRVLLGGRREADPRCGFDRHQCEAKGFGSQEDRTERAPVGVAELGHGEIDVWRLVLLGDAHPAEGEASSMQVLFKDIVSGDVDKVRERLAKEPDAANLVAKAPPKQFAGMSPLQVSYHKGAFEIAALLLDHGADPNFCDLNPFDNFGAPVLHSAIGAAVANSRSIRRAGLADRDPAEWELVKTAEDADAAFDALQRLIDAGADVSATSTHGGSALGFAVGQARQYLPQHSYSDPEWVDPKPLNDELVDDLNRIFDLLLANGADPARVEPPFGKPLNEFFAAEPAGRFLARSH